MVAGWLSSVVTGLQHLALVGGTGPFLECPVIRGASHLQALTALTLQHTYLSADQLARLVQLPGLRDLRLVRVEGGFLTQRLHGATRLTQLQLDCSPWQCLRRDLAGLQDIADIVAQVGLLAWPGMRCSKSPQQQHWLSIGCIWSAMQSAHLALWKSLKHLQLVHLQATALRSLELGAALCMTRPALARLLARLPHLELLHTAWDPDPQDALDVEFCQRWQCVLHHCLGVRPSLDWRAWECQRLRYDAAAALRQAD